MCDMVNALVCGRTLHDLARRLHLERFLAVNACDHWQARGSSSSSSPPPAPALCPCLAACPNHDEKGDLDTICLFLHELAPALEMAAAVEGRGSSVVA